ncbi:hypothetical protein, partial [Vibrio ouci]|uniref:hypothetical protein n=1 Tax=Vibrio ouci TaxID=2499078 RepID=UPI001ABFA8D7
DNWLTDIEYGGSSFFNMASFLSAGIRDTIHSYRPNWLNFNSDNYPARGGITQPVKRANVRGLLHCQVVAVGFWFNWLKVASRFLAN